MAEQRVVWERATQLRIPREARGGSERRRRRCPHDDRRRLRAAPARALPRLRSLPLPRPELGALLLLAAVLNLWALDVNGWANEYYSAAVRSMSESWNAFLFGTFDSSGVMTVDKPPMALWVQALSVRVFGFHPLAILVPQALMGIGDGRADLRPRAPPLRPPRRLRRRPRARADADHGRDLAPQQPRRAADPLLRRRAVGAGPRARGRPHPLAGPVRRARRARLRDEDGRRADGRAGDRRRVPVGRAARAPARRSGSCSPAAPRWSSRAASGP